MTVITAKQVVQFIVVRPVASFGGVAGQAGTYYQGQKVPDNLRDPDNPPQSLGSTVLGVGSFVLTGAAGVAEGINHPNATRLGGAGALLAVAQVGVNLWDKNGNFRDLTVGDLVNLAGGLGALAGTGTVATGAAVILLVGGVAYTFYELAGGEPFTLGRALDAIFSGKAISNSEFEALAKPIYRDDDTPITLEEFFELSKPIFRETFDLSDEEWAELTKPIYREDDEGRFFDTEQWEKDIAWFEDNFGSWKNLDHQGNYYIYDPLILDLDGDGIETVGVDFKTAGNNAYFDFDNDGLLNATGWVKSDDGLLVRDINNNGVINNGSEIFGDRTLKQNGELATHGFDALQDLDDNKDGIINHQDIAFNTLKIWQDYNKDGISQADELKSLSDLNIQSFRLLRM